MSDMEVAVSRPQRWDTPFDADMRDVDVDHLLEIEPLQSIDPAAFPPSLPLREILRNDARVVRFRAGELIVREGDYGHSAFLVLRGKLRVAVGGVDPESLGRETPKTKGWWTALWQATRRARLPEVRRRGDGLPVAPKRSGALWVQDVSRALDEFKTAVLEAGDFLGELAALTRSQRTATVFAETDAVLVEIRWQGLRDLMRCTPAIRDHIEQLYRENSLRVHLRETPLLAELPPEMLQAIADATVFESHGAFDWHDDYRPTLRGRRGDAIGREPVIAEEGAPVDGVLLVRSGFARLSRRYGHGNQTISYLGKGQIYNLREAVESFRTARPTPAVYSLRALGYVDVLRIPQQALADILFTHIPAARISAWLAEQLPVPPNELHAGPSSKIDQGLLEFLVERRLINGRQAMAIDLNRCTRCDDCVHACAAAHDNNPRFVRQGIRQGPIQFAHACMHCADPVCMIGCPTGAIARDQATGVVRINDLTCIGCGTCAGSCPYDNIQMVEIRDPGGSLYIDQTTGQPLSRATKCDMCVDLPGGPACQSACPHDALVRIDLGNFGGLADWIERR